METTKSKVSVGADEEGFVYLVLSTEMLEMHGDHCVIAWTPEGTRKIAEMLLRAAEKAETKTEDTL